MKDLETIAFVEAERLQPFKWGKNDCNTFVLKYLDKVWGRDLLKEAYGKYDNKQDAVIFQSEYPNMISDAIIETGAVKIPPGLAKMGDILVVDFKLFELCHLCLGSKVASVPEDGMTQVSRIEDFVVFDWALRIN